MLMVLGRTSVLLAVGCLFLPPSRLAVAESFPLPVRQSGDWVSGCDNKAVCTMVGTANATLADAAMPNRQRLAIRITSDMSPIGETRIDIWRLPADPTGQAGTQQPVVLSFAGTDGSSGAKLPGDRLSFTNGKAMDWVVALAEAKELRVSQSDVVAPRSEGFPRAWSWLTQRRAEAMRNAPVAATRRERLRPAHEVVSPAYPAVQLLDVICPEGRRLSGHRQFMLPPGDALLWAVTCNGPEGSSTHWFQSAPRFALATPLKLPDSHGDLIDAGKDSLPDSVFDFDFGVLRARHGPEGRTDCGVQRAWGWDGRGWFLLERRDMPACAGLEPTCWIRTYASP
ncbi:MAG: hypothetical protein Q8O26_02425 [Phreatobacter sp.]|uniref:DUF1176 domain-containing protein n=1 Tax=Phreatobacter sp. TaxID=1966341 RepID=UPI002733FB8E|nr:DUF1176 domain-containing protein [Phreatobacter sp.]MDP2800716.1 hypothetical protein [Phreatobacter sp.]